MAREWICAPRHPGVVGGSSPAMVRSHMRVRGAGSIRSHQRGRDADPELADGGRTQTAYGLLVHSRWNQEYNPGAARLPDPSFTNRIRPGSMHRRREGNDAGERMQGNESRGLPGHLEEAYVHPPASALGSSCHPGSRACRPVRPLLLARLGIELREILLGIGLDLLLAVLAAEEDRPSLDGDLLGLVHRAEVLVADGADRLLQG